MTMNEIMLRDMQDEGHKERMLLDLDREMRERHMRRRFQAAGEVVADVLTLAMFAFVAWLFLEATPDQYSAECEALRAEMEAQGK